MANPHFDTEVLKDNLSTSWLGQSIRYFPEMESTNTYARKLPSDEIAHGMLCITDNQTKGRGQYNRKWKSHPGKNLVFSLILLPQKTEGFHVLTLSAALSLVEQLNSILGPEKSAHIKWPNDVMIDDRKVAGILTETVFTGNKMERLVIGIGLNVNQDTFAEELSGSATSLSMEKGGKVNRERLLSDILNRFEYKYRLWQQSKTKLLKIINKNILGYGKWVTLQINDKIQEEPYKMLGINETGELLVLNRDGGIETFAYEQIRIASY